MVAHQGDNDVFIAGFDQGVRDRRQDCFAPCDRLLSGFRLATRDLDQFLVREDGGVMQHWRRHFGDVPCQGHGQGLLGGG